MKIEEGDWDGAIRAFERTHAAFPESSEALYRLLYLQHFACNFTNREYLLHAAREMLSIEISATGGSIHASAWRIPSAVPGTDWWTTGSTMTPSQALMLLDRKAPSLSARPLCNVML